MAKLRSAAAVLGALAVLFAFQSPVSADEGPATWYGPGFNGKHMSNGQVFDQYDPTTTANNEYPLGTWLRVTNPANGRSVDVQVRDRGGFGRGLDLSYAAFFTISDTSSTIWVTYEVIPGPGADPAPKPQSTPENRPVPVASGEYVVKAGDTLWGIARQYGLDVYSLAALNGIQLTTPIKVGQRLVVPAVGGTGRATSSRGTGREAEYVIQPGDTLFDIAMSHGVSLDELTTLNGITAPYIVTIGQHIKLPGPSDQPGPATSGGTVEVAVGDTLYDIADRFGVSVDELAALNGIDDPSLLMPGQILQIP